MFSALFTSINIIPLFPIQARHSSRHSLSFRSKCNLHSLSLIQVQTYSLDLLIMAPPTWRAISHFVNIIGAMIGSHHSTMAAQLSSMGPIIKRELTSSHREDQVFMCRYCSGRVAYYAGTIYLAREMRLISISSRENIRLVVPKKRPTFRVIHGDSTIGVQCAHCKHALGLKIVESSSGLEYHREGRFWLSL